MASPSSPRFAVGIDLGTTNSSLAAVDLLATATSITDHPIPQLTAPGVLEARDTLPSFLYLKAPGEFDAGADALPWPRQPSDRITGILARDHGALVPGRLVASSKSWLCHGGVDRTSSILPWHPAPDLARISPVEASAATLLHLRDAWNHAHPRHPLHEQRLVITVPASFDEIARELTIEAARKAGLPSLHLLEEPLAAFYAWLSRHETTWTEQLHADDTILVCDIGGGTTDFSLIQVRPTASGELAFHRIAVGDHLILGGDNLDLALAHEIERRAGKLDPRAWSQLIRACRHHKETLLGPHAPAEITVHLAATGAKLLAGSRQITLTRAEATSLLLDGFLPSCSLDAKPQRTSSGFREFGLPYAPDPAITRYLAHFLHRNLDPDRPPAAILLNGGFFAAPALRDRLLHILTSWYSDHHPGWTPRLLDNPRLDLAVSRGAAYYGLVREGRGVNVVTNLARSYYLELETPTGPALLCVAPAGLEENLPLDVPGDPMTLTLKTPVAFPLHVSSVRTRDPAGSITYWNEEEFTSLPPVRTALTTGKSAARSQTTVTLRSRLNENGTLELGLREAPPGDRSWRLPFDVRAATQTDRSYHTSDAETAGFLDESVTHPCLSLLDQIFAPQGSPPAELNQVTRKLETLIDQPRHHWPPSLLRRLAEHLLTLEASRRVSAAHEARWLNLLGFCLRPGHGFALDDWRVAELWKRYPAGLAHPNQEASRAENYILWRRVAGGLTPGQQQTLASPLLATLKRTFAPGKPGKGKGPDLVSGRPDTAEALRLLGSLERLDTPTRITLGNLLAQRIHTKGPATEHGAALWALARIGARQPLHASLHHVLPPDTITPWIDLLLAAPTVPSLPFALALLARKTGDRYRDLDDPLRDRILATLASSSAPAHLLALIREGGALDEKEQAQALGDSLPRGLKLIASN